MLFGTAKAVPEVILIATLCNLWGPGKVPGPAHFDDHFLNWDSRLIVIGGSRLYTSPQQWMVRLDAGNEQLCESISSF